MLSTKAEKDWIAKMLDSELEVLGSSFAQLVGPIHVIWEPSPVFRVLVRPECTNTMGRSHGGFLSALVDIVGGQGVKRILSDDRSLVTISANIEYLSAARLGDEITAGVKVDHDSRTVIFGSCLLSVSERHIARASLVFSAR
jgi:uncharacterized protein (TIGR00369 family)